MKLTNRVSRNFAQQSDATVIQVQGDFVLISYDEGGEGWWPVDALTVVDTSNWPTFKKRMLSHPGVKAMMLAAMNQQPQATLTLPAALLRAEEGNCSDFSGCWRAILSAAPDAASPLVAELSAAAVTANLPAEFVQAVSGQRVRARDAQGRFVADDPATPEDEAWV